MKSKELKQLFSRQRKLMKAALVINEKLSEVQQEINTLMLRQISSTTPKASSDKDLMTEKEVCDWIGKSKATLYRMRTYHKFPHSKIPGQKAIIYSRKDIEAYIKANQTNKLY
ncbi:helix-turn-helix transcriptional regulator [Odoribacter laneus]|uniref:helix-turn-helix transcriptional regulator n=1 Tax=Odoribacter laneus TaxID=626933 RepID=UPI002585184B|nr:helix-turn-helix domain-containing protein [Odoribacter laneus]